MSVEQPCSESGYELYSSKPTSKQLVDALRTMSVAEIYIADEYERSFQTHGMYR